jgi:hypothetical protein
MPRVGQLQSCNSVQRREGNVSATLRFFGFANRSGETRLHKILALTLFVLHTRAVSPIEGSYVARTMNGRVLPADLHLPATGGDFRLFRLEQGVLRLSGSGRFTLYFRYYHQLVPRGTRPTSTPVLSDSETGTYKVQMGRMILTPAKKKGSGSRPPITATIAGDEIRASYLLQSGSSQQRVTLMLRRDASYW